MIAALLIICATVLLLAALAARMVYLLDGRLRQKDRELTAARAARTDEVAELHRAHAEQLAEAQRASTEAIEALHQAHGDELGSIYRARTAELDAIRDAHATELAAAKGSGPILPEPDARVSVNLDGQLVTGIFINGDAERWRMDSAEFVTGTQRQPAGGVVGIPTSRIKLWQELEDGDDA